MAATTPPYGEVGVHDSGAGIADEDMGRLFEPFFTTKPDGLGMGLAISRSIVQSHRGALWAAANRGRGSTFRFKIPIPRPGLDSRSPKLRR